MTHDISLANIFCTEQSTLINPKHFNIECWWVEGHCSALLNTSGVKIKL